MRVSNLVPYNECVTMQMGGGAISVAEYMKVVGRWPPSVAMAKNTLMERLFLDFALPESCLRFIQQ